MTRPYRTNWPHFLTGWAVEPPEAPRPEPQECAAGGMCVAPALNVLAKLNALAAKHQPERT